MASMNFSYLVEYACEDFLAALCRENENAKAYSVGSDRKRMLRVFMTTSRESKSLKVYTLRNERCFARPK